MALFSAAQEERLRTATPRGEPGLSIIASGMRVEGELVTDGVVKVEGTIVGSIRAAQQVLVAKGGVVDGDIHTQEAILGGEVRGTIFASQRVEVQPTSVVHGDIATQRIVIHEGGEVNGHVKMGELEGASSEQGRHAQSAASRQPVGDEDAPHRGEQVIHT